MGSLSLLCICVLLASNVDISLFTLMFISAGVNHINSKLRKLWMGALFLELWIHLISQSLHVVLCFTDKVGCSAHTILYAHDGWFMHVQICLCTIEISICMNCI